MTTPNPPAALVARLTAALDDREIAYCHWKSNAAIAKSETAENDLDLLVRRDHAVAFRETLAHLGFTPVERQGKPFPPGKEDYLGYDAESRRLVHVDAHYQLVLGHDRTKNHRVPLEAAFLASAEHRGLFKVPSPELEYIVFLIRMVLKYGLWDEMAWQLARGRRAGPKASERDELVQLSESVDPNTLASAVRDHAPWLGGGLLDACLAVAEGRASPRQRLATGRRVRSHLDSYAQYGPAAEAALRIWRRLALSVRRRSGTLPRFRLVNGGAIVGVIGGDGSGKSTALGELGAWLEHDLDLRRIHLGKPRWSATTYVVRGALKAASYARFPARRPRGETPGNGSDAAPGFRAMAWLACTARDRYLTYRRARRFANRGGLVISDRYPHPDLESMDVPQIARLVGSRPSDRVAETLTRIEHRYHDRIAPPELLALLRVDPETAARRKTDEPADYVRRRVAEVWAVDWDASSVHVIDASQPKDAVAAQLRSLIWNELA